MIPQYDTKDLNDHLGVAVIGDYGLGKSTFIRHYLNGICRKTITIRLHTEWYRYTLEPFYVALLEHVKFISYSEEVNDSLKFKEYLRRSYVDLLRCGGVLIVVDNYKYLNLAQRDFLVDLIHISEAEYSEKNNQFIIEFDGNLDELKRDKLLECSLMYFTFLRYEDEDVEKIFKNEFSNIDISRLDMAKIIRSSRGNLIFLKRIISSLKAKKKLVFKSSRWQCLALTDHDLHDIVLLYCEDKYKELKPDYQNVIDRSAIIGQIFNIEQLLIVDS